MAQQAAGGRVPQTLLTWKFLLTYRENKGKERRENGEEKEKSKKGKWKMEMEGGNVIK